MDSTKKPSFLGPVRARGSPRLSGDDASRPPHKRTLPQGHKPRTASWHSRGSLRHKTSARATVSECPCLPQPRRHAMSNNLILVMRDSSVSSWSSPRARFAATIWRLHGPASAPPAVCRISWRSLSPSGPWRTCVRVTTSSPYESCRTNELNTSSERGHGTSANDSGYNPGPIRARGSLRPSGDAAACIKFTKGKCNADACVRRHVEAHRVVPVTHLCCSHCLRPAPAARR